MQPFLKWAGGKRKQAPFIMSHMPPSFGTYHEPFVGGGAIFFALEPERAVLADVNHRLIACYRGVRNDVDRVIALLARMVPTDRAPTEREYKAIRADKPKTDVGQAAWLIYVNRACFNGLYRENASGEFNTPFGWLTEPIKIDVDNLRACSRALRKAELRCVGFDDTIDRAQRGDLVYCDPPYEPKSTSADFTSYTAGGFSGLDHDRLRNACERAAFQRGVKVLVSGAGGPGMTNRYRAPTYAHYAVTASRSISAKQSGRAAVQEILAVSQF